MHQRTRRAGLIVAAALALALAIALALVLGPVLDADGPGGPAAAEPPDRRPALRLAQRAGLVSVGIEVRADGLRAALYPPEIDLPAPRVTRLALSADGAPAQDLPAAGCGDGCVQSRAPVPTGSIVLDVEVEYAERTRAARFRFPWPLPPGAGPLLARAVSASAGVPRVRVVERVTSDPEEGVYVNPPRIVAGEDLADMYGVGGARDVRELPARPGLRRVAYALPEVPLWVEVWIAADGRIVRDRFVSETRLWTQDYMSPP